MKTAQPDDPAYVGRRGELLAEAFLTDLHPDFLVRSEEGKIPYDFLMGFHAEDGSLRNYAVEVKATERKVVDHYSLRIDPRILAAIRTSNLPTLLLIIDVKRNEFFYNWAEHLPPAPKTAPDRSLMTVKFPVVALDEPHRKTLLAKLRS